MREIKFRAKMLDNKWEYGNIVITDHGRLFEMIDRERRYRGEVRQETIGQYTGLHDKNGKEIYEGDYIEYKVDGEILGEGIVKYSEQYAQYVLVGTGNVKDEFEPLGDYNMKVHEVIGNIYDNPELLERSSNGD